MTPRFPPFRHRGERTIYFTAILLLIASLGAEDAQALSGAMLGPRGEAGIGSMVWKKWKAYESMEHGASGGISLLLEETDAHTPDIILSLGSGYRSTRHDRKQPLLYVSGPLYADRDIHRYPSRMAAVIELSCTAPFRIVARKPLSFLAGPLAAVSFSPMRPLDLRLGIGAATGLSIRPSDEIAVILMISGILWGGVRYPWYRYIDTLCTYNYYRAFGVPVIQVRRDRSPRLGYGGSGQVGIEVFCRVGKQ